ncbi:MAG: bifunctional proline dehydrogenase/L-glutamate gamma-semialdehyde dehydrogenase PutA [Rhodobacteraceae bacterium]|nr:bifunctional proline dehydrogenase/L-glutamate gamma-semialdehyde dehydrogenase PutA [Paracoccaceae bacterium]
MSNLQEHRDAIRAAHSQPEAARLQALAAAHPVADDLRKRATARAVKLVRAIRNDSRPGLMEVFLAEYGLSTDEGVALMCLAEALLRVPDAYTMDALIEDKIAPSAWGTHLGHSSSSLVNASTWALMLTGKVLQDEGEGMAAILHGAIRRLGEPVIRKAVNRAIREMGHQFVLGRSIDEAISRGRKLAKQGYTFSYDMLGEAALTADDARKYFDAYSAAIRELTSECRASDIRANPGISVKLSALHPRYEVGQRDRVLRELVAATRKLARQAARAGMGFNIDAEEADRLDLSLDVIEAVLRDPDLAGWDGFGVVVQAYGKRTGPVLDWLHALAEKLDRRIMVRLVKGAYWDAEVKKAQVDGLDGFPVYTRKAATDVSYLICARKLLGMTDRIYPQFATHNAHSVAMILEMADDRQAFEFQRLQGMGESLHDLVLKGEGTRCRIYAPVGTHRDLLAYLVRRLLENGANSSFVNQIVDADVPPEVVAADPFAALAALGDTPAAGVVPPAELYAPKRRNSRGWDLHDVDDLAEIEAARAPFRSAEWQVGPLIAGALAGAETHTVINPANPADRVGIVRLASEVDCDTALAAARNWSATDAAERARILRDASDLYEENFAEFFAILTREAGKTPRDAIAELREAVDFLRYYADEGEAGGDAAPAGLFACISPWNFPLAIFTGQIAAALAAGNGVLAKPAETTGLVAHLAVRLLHRAGVPADVLQLLPGHGAVIGARLSADPRISGTCFTGSTATAQRIARTMAASLNPGAPLIAETGGLNAMIVDSTALPEQAIRDIITGAFQSAGQRCSALRMLYLQQDIAEPFLEMLFGAMDELVLGDPWALETDIGPVISGQARNDITAYIDAAAKAGRLIKRLPVPANGNFVPPAVIRVGGIADLAGEVFGPVLHIATFRADAIDAVIDQINATGYGLTFGMHSRIDDRVEQVTARLKAGNIYINRNQIGAIVGSQPFGGEGLSGTGPKAGGPAYLPRFRHHAAIALDAPAGEMVDQTRLQAALSEAGKSAPACLGTEALPGPTGESNLLSSYGRGTILCLGPTAESALEQAAIARANGCQAIAVAPGLSHLDGLNGQIEPGWLTGLAGVDLVAFWGDPAEAARLRQALAARDGALIGLATGQDLAGKCRIERHICIDTTAAGGNATLLAAAD